MDEQPAPAVSPTGKPLIPAAFVPYLAILAGILSGWQALGLWDFTAHTWHPERIPALVLTIVLGLLGVSPGLRSSPLLLLLLTLPLSATGCAAQRYTCENCQLLPPVVSNDIEMPGAAPNVTKQPAALAVSPGTGVLIFAPMRTLDDWRGFSFTCKLISGLSALIAGGAGTVAAVDPSDQRLARSMSFTAAIAALISAGTLYLHSEADGHVTEIEQRAGPLPMPVGPTPLPASPR